MWGANQTTRCSCYSMSMPLEHRLQILLDDERHQRITAAAHERGVSVAAVVREAIDRGLSGPESRRRGAAPRLLDAPDKSRRCAESWMRCVDVARERDRS